MPIGVGTHFSIPDSELEFSFARSSGPGGQNVNKVNSKVILRWNFLESPSVPIFLRARLLGALRTRLTLAGEILIACDEYRDQPRNRHACIEKLRACLLEAAKPLKIRYATRPSRSSKVRRVESKKRDSVKKSGRGKKWDSD